MMKGTMLIVGTDGATSRQELDRPPDGDVLRQAVGGWLEVVPNFNSINDGGRVRRCVALCNEEGKLDRPNALPRNNLANQLWTAALWRGYGVASVAPDYLVGNVVVLFGDDEFMGEL